MQIEKLVKTKNQEEYSKLYKVLTQQRELNSANKNAIARIEYAAEHNDYETVLEELQNYQNNSEAFKTLLLNTRKSLSPTPKLNIDLPKDSFFRTGLHNHPQAEMFLIDTGMLGASALLHTHDTNELWKVSKYNFEKSGDYIAKNGYLINSTSKLTPELKSFVRGKLYSQLGIYDAKGIVFKPDSTLSQSIIHSQEFKQFLGNNIHKILAEQTVKGSVNFVSDDNTHLSLGHADIIDMYIDAQGNIHAKVIDTYDFNKDDPFWPVEWAHNLQELKMLTNFYTINILVIPPEEWINLLY